MSFSLWRFLPRSTLVWASLSVSAVALDVVNVTVTRPSASESGNQGEFTITRSGSIGTLTVLLKTTGTALPAPVVTAMPSSLPVQDMVHAPVAGIGADVVLASSTLVSAMSATPAAAINQMVAEGYLLTLTFAAGETTKAIRVGVIDDTLTEGTEQITLSLRQDDAYIRGPNRDATLAIADNEIRVEQVGLDPDASEFQGAASRLAHVRTEVTNRNGASAPLAGRDRFTVMEVGGTATVETDYRLWYMPRHEADGGIVTGVIDSGSGGNRGTYRIDGKAIADGSKVSDAMPMVYAELPLQAAGTPSTVAFLEVVNGGSGYDQPPIITVGGTPVSGAGVQAQGVVVGGALVSAVITASATSTYYVAPTVTVTRSGGSTAGTGAQIRSVLTRPQGSQAYGKGYINGQVVAIIIDMSNVDEPYTYASATIAAPDDFVLGSQASATVTINGTTGYLEVDAVDIVGGSGYRVPPVVTISGDSDGALAYAVIEGPVVGFFPWNEGSGYTAQPSLTFSGGNVVGGDVATGGEALILDNTSGTILQRMTVRPDELDPNTEVLYWTVTSDVADVPAHYDPGQERFNKKGQSYVRYSNGFRAIKAEFGTYDWNPTGELSVGDQVVFGSDKTIYTIAGVNDYFVTISGSLLNDLADDTPIRNAVPVSLSANRQTVLQPLNNTVRYTHVDWAIIPLQDVTPEGAESVTLRLLSNTDYQITEPTSISSVIADDDAIIDISLKGNASEPNTTGYATITLSNALPRDISLSLSVSGTATAGYPTTLNPEKTSSDGNPWIDVGDDNDDNSSDVEITARTDGDYFFDYIGLPSSVTIPAGTTSLDLPIIPRADRRSESQGEYVTITLNDTKDGVLGGSSSSSANPSATVNISDSQGTLTIGSIVGGYESSNGVGQPATAVVTLTRPVVPAGAPTPTYQPVNISFQVAGTAKASVDYVLSATTLTTTRPDPQLVFDPVTGLGSLRIANDQNLCQVQLVATPIDDVITEGDETLVITLVGGPGYDIDGSASQSTATIQDDEPTVSITTVSNGAEPDTPIVFSVAYPNGPDGRPLNRAIVVQVQKTGGTATEGEDFATPPVSVQIPANDNDAQFQVTPLDDGLVESSESIVLAIKASETGLYSINSVLSSATGLIVDDEPTLRFTTSSATATEDPITPVTGDVVIGSNRALNRAVTVNFTIAGTATSGTDYTLNVVAGGVSSLVSTSSGAGSFTIPATATGLTQVASLRVTPLDDLVSEGSETVAITLTTGTGYTLGTTTAGTITIQDDETGLSVTSSVTSLSEPSGTALITVSGRKNTTYTLAVTGSATAGLDYTGVPASVVLPNATGPSSSTSFTLVVQDDRTLEADEVIMLTVTGDGQTDSVSVILRDDGDPDPNAPPGSSLIGDGRDGGGGCGVGGGLAALLAGVALLTRRRRV